MSRLVSDEVAEDYKNSLEDLTTNDRFQISNLTVIAKENTEHAMAISRVLENHIRSVGVFLLLLSSGVDQRSNYLCRHHLRRSCPLCM